MKRYLIATGVLIGFSLLISVQLGRLEALSPRLSGLRRHDALGHLGPLPAAAARENVRPLPLGKSKRLEEIIRRAPKVLGGVPLPMPEALYAEFPQLEADFLKAKKAQLRLDHADFFAEARLTPAQIERYLEISLDGEREWIAQTREAEARGVTLSDPSIKRLGQEGAARRKQELEELLGPEGLARRDKYRDQRESRRALREMAKASVLGDHPLTADQLDHLATMTVEAGVFDGDRPWQAVGFVSGATRKSAGILSPEQQELFELLIDARQAQLLRAFDRRKNR